MNKKVWALQFWYFGELFILLRLTGLTHASWWWLVLFYGIDIQEGLAFYLGSPLERKKCRAAQTREFCPHCGKPIHCGEDHHCEDAVGDRRVA